MNKSIFLSFIIAAVSLNMSAQTEIAPYAPGATPEGITYYLPRTELHIIVTATSTTYKPGDFRQYAARYLRLDNIPRDPSVSWKIDEIKMYAVGVPDTSKIFTVKLNPKTSAPLVGLTRNGILLSINADAPAQEKLPALPEPVIKNSNLNPRDFMGQEILAAGSIAKMAELTANEIYDIRESRTLLAKGEADNMPKDGEQLKLMNERLDTQERALLQLFKGTETVETRSFEFVYNPTENVERDILFRFSSKLGPVDNDDLAGSPIYISIKNKQTAPAPMPADPKAKKKILNDIRYNVPSDVEVKIFNDKNTYINTTYPMGQFGNVEHLGEDLFNKKMGTHVLFNGMTGGISKLEMPDPSEK